MAAKAKDVVSAQDFKVVYLPSIFDPVKVRAGIIEIINLVKMQDLADRKA